MQVPNLAGTAERSSKKRKEEEMSQRSSRAPRGKPKEERASAHLSHHVSGYQEAPESAVGSSHHATPGCSGSRRRVREPQSELCISLMREEDIASTESSEDSEFYG